MSVFGRAPSRLPVSFRRSLLSDRAVPAAPATPADRRAADQARKRALYEAAYAEAVAAGYAPAAATARAKARVPFYFG